MPRYLVVPVLFFAACVDPSDQPDEIVDEPVPTEPAYAPPRQGMETQGRYLLGAGLDVATGGVAGQHFSVRTTGVQVGAGAVTVEIIGGALLRVQGTATPADNLVLPGATGGQLALDLSREEAGTSYYRIAYRATAGSGTWSDPCAGAEAVPMAGTFTTTGLHTDTAARLTFACADGVAYKCIDWGYRPGAFLTAEMWDIHQACTRMARGDYCGDGVSHTREGTTIFIYDEVGINPAPPAVFEGLTQWPPPPGADYFEAGWRGGTEAAVCLSRLRWQSLPIDGYCSNGHLPDPRVDTQAKFCDEFLDSDAGFTFTDTKLFNSSRYSDLRLHAWQRGADRISTIDGYYSDPSVTPPLEPYDQVGTYDWHAPDGMLLRTLPESIDLGETVEVKLYGALSGDLVYLPVTAAALLPNHVELGWRGMAFNSPRTDTTPLVLYQHPTTGDTTTTTLGTPPGYQSLGTVAHVWPGE